MPMPFEGLTPAPGRDHVAWVVEAMAGRQGVDLVVPEGFDEMREFAQLCGRHGVVSTINVLVHNESRPEYADQVLGSCRELLAAGPSREQELRQLNERFEALSRLHANEQRADIAHPPGSHGAGLAQVGLGRRIRGAQYDLPGYRTSARGIPHGLGGDPILATAHFSLKKVHFHHVALDMSGPQ